MIKLFTQGKLLDFTGVVCDVLKPFEITEDILAEFARSKGYTVDINDVQSRVRGFGVGYPLNLWYMAREGFWQWAEEQGYIKLIPVEQVHVHDDYYDQE